MRSNRKYLLCLFLLGVFCISASAQNQNKIDSLLIVLKNAKEDTNKVRTLVMLSAATINNNPIVSLNYARQTFALSEKLKFTKGKIQGLNNTGLYYYATSDYDSALVFYERASGIAKETNEKSEAGNIYSNIGNIYSSKGEFDKSREYKIKALKVFEELKDTVRIAKASRNIGIDFADKGDYPSALSYYFNGLKLSEAIKDSLGIAVSHLCIGEIYSYENEYEKALNHHFQSLKICLRRNDLRNIAVNSFDIANNYMGNGNYNEAFKYYIQAKEKAEKINLKMIVASSCGGIGEYYVKINEVDSGLKYYKDALKQFKEIGDQVRSAELYNNIGETYSRMKNYEKAIANFDNALLISNEIGTQEVNRSCYQSLAEIYSKLKNYKLAYDNYVLFKQTDDSINNIESTKKVTEIEGKYNTEKKEKEIALLTKDKEIQNVEIKKQTLLKNSFIGGLALVLVLFFFIYTNYSTRQKLKLENIRNNIAADLHDDIGSTLNSISLFSEVAKQEAGKAIPALDQIGVSARKIIDSMSDIVWTINPENDTFENVIARMRSLAYLLLKAKNIEFTFKADESLNQLSLPMVTRKNVYLLFKEATNNIVKYSNASRANFHITHENKNVKMVIRDNGVGFDMENSKMGNGIKNMKRRAGEIGGQLLIESAEGKGTNIELSFKS
jgi:signal transduction histidine kinase/Tfp pilus assembly protein PilF